MTTGLIPALPLLILALPALADPATIEDAMATRSGDGWRIDVTLSHAETGWDDYADGWRVETGDGDVLGTRDLLHPHADEQPFTRSVTLDLPDGTTTVWIRARTNVDGWGETRAEVGLE